MSETERKQSDILSQLLRKLSPEARNRLLLIAEGMAIMADRAAQTQPGAVGPGA